MIEGTDGKIARTIIAIDGLSASGKGTLARQLADKLRFRHLDTGKLYRLVAWRFMLAGGDTKNIDEVVLPIATDIKKMFLQGRVDDFHQQLQKYKKDLSTDEVARMASFLAKRDNLRQLLKEAQWAFADQHGGIVMDGRDIGTVIFPSAPIKFFIIASLEVRAERRYLELQSLGIPAKEEDILSDLKARDEADSTRAVAPLKPASDAVVIDSSQRSVDDMVMEAIKVIKKKLPNIF